MLSVGELAVRRVSKFEAKAEASARGTKINFKLTYRIQVNYYHPSCSPLSVLMCLHNYSCYLSLSVCATPLSPRRASKTGMASR